MFYDIDGQINNLYSMHGKSLGNASMSKPGQSNYRDIKDSDIELIRERMGLLQQKAETMERTFKQEDVAQSLTPEKQMFWRKRVEQLFINVERLPQNLDRALRNYQRQKKDN